MPYLFLLTVIFCLTYAALYRFLPLFFGHKAPKPDIHSALSLICIILLSLIAYIVSFSLPNQELGNRILHAFGGGFLAFLTCFFVVKNTKLHITKFQFFVIAFLVTTSLGVGNELLEFTLQNITGLIFANSITDTWLDLTSNTIGALIAATCLVPFIRHKEK